MKPEVASVALAGSVGTYLEAVPAPALRSHFQCLWLHRMPVHGATPITVVPDGCVDLLWMNDGLTVAGPDRHAVVETIAPGSAVVGLRFRPAAAVHWLRLPMSDLVDRRVSLEDIWGADARRLADWVCGAATSAEIARRLQSGLKDRAARAAPADGDMTAVFALLRDGGSHTTPSVANVVAQLRLSERTLRRRCHHAFGYGPKTLERILRFQRFLALARRFSGNGLARCAAEAGYADQAHLSREIRQLCGLSPRAVVDQIA